MRQPALMNVLILAVCVAFLAAPATPVASAQPVAPIAPLSIEAFETSQTVWSPMGDTDTVRARVHEGEKPS